MSVYRGGPSGPAKSAVSTEQSKLQHGQLNLKLNNLWMHYRCLQQEYWASYQSQSKGTLPNKTTFPQSSGVHLLQRTVWPMFWGRCVWHLGIRYGSMWQHSFPCPSISQKRTCSLLLYDGAHKGDVGQRLWMRLNHPPTHTHTHTHTRSHAQFCVKRRP